MATKRQRLGRQEGYVAFDIETSGLLEAGKETPRVTCVVTMRMHLVRDGKFDLESARRWHEDLHEEGAFMSVATLQELICYLTSNEREGFVPLTWNGANFDFRVLYQIMTEAGLTSVATEVRPFGGCTQCRI